MKILIATHHLGIIGGVETHLQALLPLLQAAGNEIGVVYEHQGIQVGASILDRIGPVPLWCGACKSPSEVVREVQSWQPDVVYSHALSSPLLDAALAEEWPAVLFAHAYYGTCISGTKCFRRLGLVACRRTFGLGCLACYFPLGCGGGSPVTMARLYRVAAQRRHNLDKFRAVIVGSRHMFSEFARHCLRGQRLAIAPLFPPGMTRDPDPPAVRRSTGRILFVGRIADNKGWRHLLKALPLAGSQLGRNLTLVVVGDGPARMAMEAYSRQLGIDAEFLGWVTPDCVEAEMRAADLLAIPSVWPEPFGMVGLEAACVGLPSVGYAVGGIPDWLVPGVSGEAALGARPQWKQLAAAFHRALQAEPGLARLRRGAWEVAEGFTPAQHLSVVQSVLDSAIEHPSPSSSPSIRT